ncbi:MAG: hypothetical protein WBV18_06705 [Methyloceanibacter sp.]
MDRKVYFRLSAEEDLRLVAVGTVRVNEHVETSIIPPACEVI